MIYELDAHDDVAKAAELWAAAEKLPKRSRLDEWYRHWLSALLHAYRNEHDEAVTEARATIAMAPYDTVSHASLSWVMREAGELDEALEWAIFAATHEPHMYNRSYFRTLKDAYNGTGEWAEAVELARGPDRQRPGARQVVVRVSRPRPHGDGADRPGQGGLEKGHRASRATGAVTPCPAVSRRRGTS